MPYTPHSDAVSDTRVIRDFIRSHPLASLISHDGTAPDANFIPLLPAGEGDDLTLIGHIARKNPLGTAGRQQGPVLAVFGPAEHYISPTWYPSKEPEHKKVPTWNYLVAHAWVSW